MYTIVTKPLFISEFERFGRAENFSHEALAALYDFLEEISDHELEKKLDVVALCSSYAEVSQDEFEKSYNSDDSLIIYRLRDSLLIRQY